jgi:hypothetical protein
MKKNTIQKIFKHEYFIAFLIFLFLSFFALRTFILSPGIVDYRDLIWPKDLNVISENLFYATNLDWTRRIIYLGPIISSSLFLGIDSSIVEKFLFLFFRTLTGFSMFFVTYKVFQNAKLGRRTPFILSVYSGFVYTHIPSATMMVAPAISLQFSYSMLPLAFYYFHQAINKNNFKSCFLASVFLTLTIAGTMQYLVLMPIMFGLWLLLNIIFEFRNRKKIWGIIRSSLIISLLFLAFSSYWVVPSLLIVKSGITLSPSYVLTYEMLDVFSRDSNLLNSFRLMADWWPRIPLTPLENIPPTIWTILTFTLPIFAFISLFFSRKSKEYRYILMISLIALIFLFFYKGTREPFGWTYRLLYDIPIVGWMFRVPAKIGMILPLLYTIMVTFTIYKIFTWKNRTIVKYTILLFVVGSLCIISWPAFTGDFGGIFNPIIKDYEPKETANISVPINNFLVLGELSKATSLDFIYTNYSSIFMEQSLENNKIFNTRIENLIFDNEYSNLIFSYSNKQFQIVNTFESTYHHNPSILWSKAATNDPLHGPWHAYLENRGIENWQSDYDMGLVFTWAASKLVEKPTPTGNDLIDQWTFESKTDLDQWENYTRETQFGALHPLTLDNNALQAEFWNSTWGWKIINSPLIPVEYGNWYRWELQIKGENAHGVYIKIVEYDQKQKIINARQVKSIGSGNFDWNTITLDYTPEKLETKYIQIQIWHGHETTQPLPNTIWIDDIKVYDLQRFIEPVTLDIPYTLPQTDQYILLARVFQNQQGGKILVQNDKEKHVVNTWDQFNKFTWVQLDNTTLQQGQHKINLTNLKGFNAVNLFALIPAQEYRDAQTRLTETLQDKRIIYILEAESDMYRENTVTTNKYGGEASNGQILELTPSSTTWREIETAKLGNYTIAIRGKGNLNIKIDEQENQTHTDQLNWTYIGPIHLEKGTHRIEITSPSTYLAQWNFEKDEPLEWKGTISNVQTLSLSQKPYEGATSLEAELNASTWGWKTITSPLITVTPNTKYTWSFHISGENAHKAHVKIVEYDQDKKPVTGQYMKGIGDGNFTWTPISFDYTPTQNATYIALQIWHGHETTQPLPNKLWLDEVQVTGYQPSDLDVVWIYSTNKPNETLEDIFNTDESPAKLLEYTKIDPTKYTAKINATKPFMLSFAESYDPLWVARVNGHKTRSIPLYSVINGFWIEETGPLDITIEYEPQRWFYMGSAISVTTLTACAIYLTYEWIKNKAILKRVQKWLRSNSS